MNSFDLEIWDDEGGKCTFYTVYKADATHSETDKFFTRYEESTHAFHDDANLLLRFILTNIGDKYGAIDAFFDRQENKAVALPPKPKKWIPEIEEIGPNFPLRLYCFRISSSIVVLFNGGIKDAATAQASRDLSFVFYEAQVFAQTIMNNLCDMAINLTADGRYLEDYDGHTNKITL